MILLALLLSVLLVAGDTYDVDTSGSGGDLIDLHIIGFFPCTNPEDKREIPVDNCDGIDRIPIMRLALEEINERCDLLPGYRLVVNYANSGCASIPAMYHLIQQTDPSLPTKLMILGPTCSIASELMGEVAQRYMNLTQVAYTVTSALFGKDKIRFPRFYRLVPITEKQTVDGYVALIEKLGWNRVAIISDESELTVNAATYTEEKLTSQRVLRRLQFSDDPSKVMDVIEELRARIIVAWINRRIAVKFWCKVVRRKLAGQDFVWLIPGWFGPNWWAAVDGTDCTAEEMKKSLEHTLEGLAIGLFDYDPDRVLVSKKTVARFQEDLEKKYDELEITSRNTGVGAEYIYDAAWTIALALNASISTLEKKGLGRLEEYHSEWTEMSDVLTASVANVEFEGISGKVSFHKKSGNRKNPSMNILQYRDGVAVPIKIYLLSSTAKSFIDLPGQNLIWQGGYMPKDAPSPMIQHHSIVEIAIVALTAAVGILSSLFFLVFNIYYHNHPVVKRSSFCLNCVIISAILMGFIGTALYTIEPDDTTDSVAAVLVCNLRHWMIELAFIVSFATFFTKIWRLYKLFFNTDLKERKHLEDQYLLLAVGVIVTPALIVLIVQASIYPVALHKYAKINKDNFAQEEITFTCQGRYDLAFHTVLILIRTILGILSLKIAFETKKHLPTEEKYRKYYESAVINLSTIVSIIPSSICEVAIVLLYIHNQQTGLLLLIVLRECLWMYPMSFMLFIPKVYKVYRGMIAVSLKRFSVIRNHCSKSSPLTSRPSTWSIPRFSFIDRRASSVMSQSIKKFNSDLNTTEVTLRTSDNISIPQSNPPNSLSQDCQNHQSHKRNQNCCGICQRNQQCESRQRSQHSGSHLSSKYRWRQHHNFRYRITLTEVPEQDENNISDCVVIANTNKSDHETQRKA